MTGRQKLQCALSSQQLMSASAPARFSIAKSRACSTSVSPSLAATVRNVRLYISGGEVVFVKKPARAFCSGVRWLPTAPSSLTSLYSFAYAPLVMSCGPFDRNCDVLSSTKGSTLATQAFGSLGPDGVVHASEVVGRHSPGSSPHVNRNGP